MLLAMIALSWFAVVPAVEAQGSNKSTIKLVGGEVMSGVVGVVKDGSLSVITDYGPVRIPLHKISPESKATLGITEGAANTAALTAKIRELEELVVRLREENATLRRAATSGPAIQPLVTRPSSNTGAIPSSGGTGMSYRISSTGKRHNSRCRYYSSNGRAGSANEGVACKICGG